jgi:hypothetical protein
MKSMNNKFLTVFSLQGKNHMVKYSVYQNDFSGLEADYIHKYGEQNFKY